MPEIYHKRSIFMPKKKEAGIRDVYLSDGCEWIIKKIFI